MQLVKSYATDLPPVNGDPQQLQQVFVNIMLNAYQSMPQGGRLEIKTWAKDNTVTVAFSDEGVGIPPKYMDRIFDPFFTTKEPGEGTGLGLSVSYGIVQRHGGSIDVESKEGKGTTFTIRLPLPQETTTMPTQTDVSDMVW
jgi:two-component system NtrC family sensor kinase